MEKEKVSIELDKMTAIHLLSYHEVELEDTEELLCESLKHHDLGFADLLARNCRFHETVVSCLKGQLYGRS